MQVKLKSLEDTAAFASDLVTKLTPGTVLALYGGLGAGKTTFTKYLVAALGIDAKVQSPTFVVARKYMCKDNSKIKAVNHIDLYRMTSLAEVSDIGLEELFEEPNSVTIIEWPENAESILPKSTIVLKFEVTNDERTIEIQNLH